MKTTTIISSVCALLFSVSVRAQDANYLDYAIPADARKIGPDSMRDPNITEANYVKDSKLVGKERLDHGVLVLREIYDSHEKKHGVQREWFRNGQRKSEEPYKHGVMHGVFKKWSQDGALIGQSTIVEGTGKLEVYDEDGVFTEETNYEGNKETGLFVSRLNYPGIPDHRMTLMWFKDGARVGAAYDFYEGGALSGMNFAAGWASVVGPAIHFKISGDVETIKWYLNRAGQHYEVTEAEYAQATALDPKLPPYYHEPDKYREEFVTPEVRALVKHYQEMPPVKIPLEFGPDGKPILARQP